MYETATINQQNYQIEWQASYKTINGSTLSPLVSRHFSSMTDSCNMSGTGFFFIIASPISGPEAGWDQKWYERINRGLMVSITTIEGVDKVSCGLGRLHVANFLFKNGQQFFSIQETLSITSWINKVCEVKYS